MEKKKIVNIRMEMDDPQLLSEAWRNNLKCDSGDMVILVPGMSLLYNKAEGVVMYQRPDQKPRKIVALSKESRLELEKMRAQISDTIQQMIDTAAWVVQE